MFAKSNSIARSKFGNVLHSDPNVSSAANEGEFPVMRHSSASDAGNAFYEPNRVIGGGSPMTMSPWDQVSPFSKPPWPECRDHRPPQNALIGSLVREEGHIYSLASSGELLYTGSDSKNIRVWKNLQEFSAFKSSSGLVKAIVISGEKIFTGHQDGKIRVWKLSEKNPSVHKRAETLPSLKDILRNSFNWKNYVEVRRNRSTLWIKHSDAISCMSISEDGEFLYSASWDRTMKVWRLSDSKCIESVTVHDDAVNAVVTTSGGLVFTGSADGTVKVWHREKRGKATKHTLDQILLKQDSAVTALAVNGGGSIVYSGSSDGLVNFWSGEKKLSMTLTKGVVLKGHRLAILCLAEQGNMVFSGSADKTICVWRRKGLIHTCVSVLAGHSGPVKCLAVEDDRDQRWILYSGSLDKSVKVWSVGESVPDFNQTAMVQQQSVASDVDSFQSDRTFSSTGTRSGTWRY